MRLLFNFTLGFSFLQHAEKSVSFGSVFYPVQDSNGNQCRLAVNSRAVVLFDASNIYAPKKVSTRGEVDSTPVQVFPFGQVDDILTLEDCLVLALRSGRLNNHDLDSAGAQTLPGGAPKKFSFKCASAQHAKRLWAAAVAQHKFFRSRLAEVSGRGRDGKRV